MGKRGEEIVSYVHRILEITRLCPQSLLSPFAVGTVVASGHTAIGPSAHLPSLTGV